MKLFRAILSFSLLAWVALPGSAQTAADISLTFLGTGAPRPSLKRYGPSILVETDKHRLLVDAGSGLRERVYQAGAFALLTSIDHVLVTHLHYDHTIGLPDLWLSGWLYGRGVPLRVQGPPGGEETAGGGFVPGVSYEHEGLKVSAFGGDHMPIDAETGAVLDFRGR